MGNRAKPIMIQGTMSSAGKSFLCTGLCRFFKQEGFRVAPFKSQNMALNSFITKEGLEMGRAQVTQAEAAGAEPSVYMNPVLLKPTTDMGSQVIVNGEVIGNMPAAEYYRYKKGLKPKITEAYETLSKQYDIIVIEGAGSPAEINLKADDIVNMGMAELADAPVLLVGDIDRGGVFASLYGTIALLEPKEQDRIKGVIINKFRGDLEILKPGLAMLEDKIHKPVAGVVPYLPLDIEEEDSLTERFYKKAIAEGRLDIAVIRLPKISNFTDFHVLEQRPDCNVRYIYTGQELGRPDLLILPGTKNTMGDLAAIRQNGIEAAMKRLASEGVPVLGICGGYQMLGETIEDPDAVEQGGKMQGMGLLPIATVFGQKKERTRVCGVIENGDGPFAALNGAELEGYEIHMGKTVCLDDKKSLAKIKAGDRIYYDGLSVGNIMGSYIHGFFDSQSVTEALLGMLCRQKGIEANGLCHINYQQYKESQYDALADALRESLDMDFIYRIMKLK